MQKIIICNIPMKRDVDITSYPFLEEALPISERAVRYPVNAVLEKNLKSEDEVKVILLAKEDGNKNYEKNIQFFKNELEAANKDVGAKIQYVQIVTKFDESIKTHNEVLNKLIDNIDENAKIIADITYGSKDVPIIVFTALNFAEKFLGCDIDHIIYGKAVFGAGRQIINTELCDLVPLFYLNSITNVIREQDPTKARAMLKKLTTNS